MNVSSSILSLLSLLAVTIYGAYHKYIIAFILSLFVLITIPQLFLKRKKNLCGTISVILNKYLPSTKAVFCKLREFI